jgi:hypothetical protein
MECEWDMHKRPHSMSWGDGTDDEMCFGAFMYYPRQRGLGAGEEGDANHEVSSYVFFSLCE